ncbi:hypothetical protein E4U42_001012 [Claviceps africana]|uniref:Sexual differentiation process protein isp4 n=1 Tax=Claviceps africana TaxID=83212 RepID=A0A8K0IZJ0_9HYPO|nr:hypothetical protein E4U42_001012 [Claviceps africana]
MEMEMEMQMQMAKPNVEQSQAFGKSRVFAAVDGTFSQAITGRIKTVQDHSNVTEDDVLEAEEMASSMSLEHLNAVMENVRDVHDGDPNFPHLTMQKIRDFLGVRENPDRHKSLIHGMKVEAALMTQNSPYAEVRAVTKNHDDPAMPVSTVRAWAIGLVFCCSFAFANQFLPIRQPPILLDGNATQLLAYPVGKAWERWMPRIDVRIPFTKHAINWNPGRFNKKEHMLIVLMVNASQGLPFCQEIVCAQVLPQLSKQRDFRSFSYIFLNALSTSCLAYGLAGLTRRFLVYPSYCIWHQSLGTIALNTALHNETDHSPHSEGIHPIEGLPGLIHNVSRRVVFVVSFLAMFVYSWLPQFSFRALQYFSWMTWFAPRNVHLNVLTGMQNGLGLFNPFPTFDWTVISSVLTDPLTIPALYTFNFAGGMFMTGLIILGVWYTNTWNTGYLPVVRDAISRDGIFDHFGLPYEVPRVLDGKGNLDLGRYSNYSAVYMSAGKSLSYGMSFALYSALVTHMILQHRSQLKTGLKNVARGLGWRGSRANCPGKRVDDNMRGMKAEDEDVDVNNRLMAAYPKGTYQYVLVSHPVALCIQN